MRKEAWILIALLLLLPFRNSAQTDGHYTMFMFNKLYYNPAYAGEREVTSFNATYRDQWTDMPGAPKSFNCSIDAPVGKFTRQFRPVAVGLSLNNEQLGVEKYTTVMGNYAYRIPVKNAVLSLGIRGGVKLYSANYDLLDLSNKYDPNFQGNVSNLILPNFGLGGFWSVKDKNELDKYFLGFSIPMLLQNRYGKNSQNNSVLAKETRTMYLSGGYVFQIDQASHLTCTPQAIVRLPGNFNYRAPVNCDFNLAITYCNRVMFGITYRTDRSVEFIAHLQVLHDVNIGYAYDYSLSALSIYSGKTHELMLGFDLNRKNSKYLNPRFLRSF